MTIDKAQLKALAEAANAVTTDVNITMAVGSDPDEVKAVQDYLQVAMPKNILAILAEIERLEERNVYWIDQANIISKDRIRVRRERDHLERMKDLAEEARDLYAADKKRLMLALNDARAETEALRKRIADDEQKLDALLAHCDDGECVTCGQIICKHGDGMHFHHDGCPSCAQEEEPDSDLSKDKEL